MGARQIRSVCCQQLRWRRFAGRLPANAFMPYNARTNADPTKYHQYGNDHAARHIVSRTTRIITRLIVAISTVVLAVAMSPFVRSWRCGSVGRGVGAGTGTRPGVGLAVGTVGSVVVAATAASPGIGACVGIESGDRVGAAVGVGATVTTMTSGVTTTSARSGVGAGV